jgi:hypothetical protein
MGEHGFTGVCAMMAARSAGSLRDRLSDKYSRRNGEKQCDSGCGKRPSSDMTRYRRLLSSKAQYSAVEQIVSLKPHGGRQRLLLTPPGQTQNCRCKNQRPAVSCVVVGSYLHLVGNIVCKAPERGQPEQCQRKEAARTNTKRVAPFHVSCLMSDDCFQLGLGEKYLEPGRYVDSRGHQPNRKRGIGKTVDNVYA